MGGTSWGGSQHSDSHVFVDSQWLFELQTIVCEFELQNLKLPSISGFKQLVESGVINWFPT